MVSRSETMKETPSIPLPDEIPPPPDLSHLPKDVLHSSTVETLLTQNQDLMARLAVNIRRCAEMEENALLMEQKFEALRFEKQVATDQVQVFKEKEKLQKAQGLDTETQLIETKNQL